MSNVILVKIYVCLTTVKQLSIRPNFGLTKHDPDSFNLILLCTKTHLSNMHIETYYRK